MITNETRARLIGYVRLKAGRLPNFMLDANAVAELRAFVRARGKEAEFSDALMALLPVDVRANPAYWFFDILDATPAQQNAAFDAVFRDDLERINER